MSIELGKGLCAAGNGYWRASGRGVLEAVDSRMRSYMCVSL